MHANADGNAARTESGISPGSAYYIYILLILLYVFDYVDRMVVSSLFPFIKEDWGLSDTQCGMLMSAVYWSIIVFSLPVSFLIDRWSRRKTIALMALIWSLATGACAFTRNFTQLFIVRSIIGIGEAGYAPGGTAMISAIFSPAKRALALGVWTASIPLGAAGGIALGGVVATHLGWQHAFGLVALPGIVVALLFFKTKDYKSVELIKKQTNPGLAAGSVKMSRRDIAREFTSTPSLLLTYVAFAGNTFVTTALLCWLPSYFHRTQGMAESDAGLKSSLIMVFAIVGSPLGGFLADRWSRKQRNARILVPAISSCLTAGLLFSAFAFFEGTLQYVVLLSGGLAASIFVPGAAAVTQDVVHPGLRATSYGFCVIVQNLLGSSLGPIFVGAVSDASDITFAMTLLPAFSLLAGLLFFAGALFYNRDLDKVEAIDLEFSAT